jgi:hypothetical protein
MHSSLMVILLFNSCFFQVARAKYLESQNTIRREILTKKLEKNSGRIIEDLVWGVPKGSKFSFTTASPTQILILFPKLKLRV